MRGDIYPIYSDESLIFAQIKFDICSDKIDVFSEKNSILTPEGGRAAGPDCGWTLDAKSRVSLVPFCLHH